MPRNHYKYLYKSNSSNYVNFVGTTEPKTGVIHNNYHF